jgi:hypothetical protein
MSGSLPARSASRKYLFTHICWSAAPGGPPGEDLDAIALPWALVGLPDRCSSAVSSRPPRSGRTALWQCKVPAEAAGAKQLPLCCLSRLLPRGREAVGREAVPAEWDLKISICVLVQRLPTHAFPAMIASDLVSSRTRLPVGTLGKLAFRSPWMRIRHRSGSFVRAWDAWNSFVKGPRGRRIVNIAGGGRQRAVIWEMRACWHQDEHTVHGQEVGTA